MVLPEAELDWILVSWSRGNQPAGVMCIFKDLERKEGLDFGLFFERVLKSTPWSLSDESTCALLCGAGTVP